MKLWKDNKGSFAEEVRNNPLLRSSFFWALRYGDANTKLQVTEALRWIEDEEMSEILQGLLKQQPLQEEKLQEAALLSLQRLIGSVPEENVLQEAKETSNARLKGLPEWREDWQKVIDQTVSMMDRRFDAVQKKDAELLWKQFVSSIYPDVPFIRQTEGWCAALEYLIAKMHNLPVTYREVAQRYDVSVSMVSRYARRIDDECSFQGSVSDSLPPFTENI